MYQHRNTLPDSSLSRKVENTEQEHSSWFAAYPNTEPDEGMVDRWDGEKWEPITLDEYCRIKTDLVCSPVSDRPASTYLNEGVA